MKALRLLPVLCGLALPAFAQGPLTPSAGPAPTMKALDQLEPRTVVNTANTPGDAGNTFIISAPGSYYLAGNLTGAAGKHGISVRASHVTLDLGGFSLVSGGSGTVRGIDVPAAQVNLHLRNGTVRGWSDGGIRADNAQVLASQLRLFENAAGPGLAVGNGSLVRECVANANQTGFVSNDRCQFADCIATINVGMGFTVTNFVSIIDCTSSRNGSTGFFTGGVSNLLRCSATRNAGYGIETSSGSTVTECTAGSNVFGGIYGAAGSTIARCTARANGTVGESYSGISVSSGSVANCTVTANFGDGINASFSSVTNCAADGNTRIGISGFSASVMSCISSSNGQDGIYAPSGVVAFCKAASNNQSNNGSSDIYAPGASRTGNNPAP